METTDFPKMEQFHLQEWIYSEDTHLQRQYEDPLLDLLPTIPQLDSVFKDSSLPVNFFLEYPNNLENFGADFHLWDECPPLCENALKPLTQLPPSLPYMIDNSKGTSFDDAQSLLSDSIFNDQSLDTVVAEGLTMPRQGNKVKVSRTVVIGGDNYYLENEEITKIKTKIESINKEEIRKYFDMPISKAAKELNVGLTVLKKRCRELDIKRWPHRKIKSLEALISNVKAQGDVKMVERLEELKRKLHSMPWLELNEETKKLRQQCFKANYKRRRALALTHSPYWI